MSIILPTTGFLSCVAYEVACSQLRRSMEQNLILPPFQNKWANPTAKNSKFPNFWRTNSTLWLSLAGQKDHKNKVTGIYAGFYGIQNPSITKINSHFSNFFGRGIRTCVRRPLWRQIQICRKRWTPCVRIPVSSESRRLYQRTGSIAKFLLWLVENQMNIDALPMRWWRPWDRASAGKLAALFAERNTMEHLGQFVQCGLSQNEIGLQPTGVPWKAVSGLLTTLCWWKSVSGLGCWWKAVSGLPSAVCSALLSRQHVAEVPPVSVSMYLWAWDPATDAWIRNE